jgi:LysR family glycine cleavage system transcriptional activator
MATPPDRVPLNALRVFEAVAAHLSFTAAAKELGVTTAAVSAQIKSLETDIGVPLFRRHTRAVALTQEGAELLPGVRRGLEELRRSVERIRRERVGGMLNLSVPNEFLQRWLLPRLGEFTRRHPEIEVRFGPPRAAGLDFGRDDFHAAIVYGPGQWTGLKAERLLDEYVFPVCSPVLLARFGPIETVARRRNLIGTTPDGIRRVQQGAGHRAATAA